MLKGGSFTGSFCFTELKSIIEKDETNLKSVRFNKILSRNNFKRNPYLMNSVIILDFR